MKRGWSLWRCSLACSEVRAISNEPTLEWDSNATHGHALSRYEASPVTDRLGALLTSASVGSGGAPKLNVTIPTVEPEEPFMPIYTPATTGGELTKGDAWTDAPVPLSSSPTVEEDRWPRRINFGSWRGATL